MLIAPIDAIAQLPNLNESAADTSSSRSNSLDFNNYLHTRGLSVSNQRVPSYSIAYQRRNAVDNAWKQEQELVQKTGQGTRNWSESERKALLNTGKVKGYQGHHINNVKYHPELAGKPNNIKFVKGWDGHLNEHKGNFRNETSGKLIDRTIMLKTFEIVSRTQYVVVGAVAAGGGIMLLAYYGPEAYDNFQDVLNPATRSEQDWLELGHSGFMTASGVGLTTSGTTRGIAFAISKIKPQGMHRFLSPITRFSRGAGVFAAATLVVAGGFYYYQWDQGYISTRVFVTQTSGLAGGAAGALFGGTLGVLGGPIAPVTIPLGTIIGGFVGSYIGSSIVDNYYQGLDEKAKEQLHQYIYAKYQ